MKGSVQAAIERYSAGFEAAQSEVLAEARRGTGEYRFELSAPPGAVSERMKQIRVSLADWTARRRAHAILPLRISSPTSSGRKSRSSIRGSSTAGMPDATAHEGELVVRGPLVQAWAVSPNGLCLHAERDRRLVRGRLHLRGIDGAPVSRERPVRQSCRLRGACGLRVALTPPCGDKLRPEMQKGSVQRNLQG